MCGAALLIVHVTGADLVFPLETGRTPLPVTLTIDNGESIGSIEVELTSTLEAVVAIPDRLIVQPGGSSEAVVSLDPNKLGSREEITAELRIAFPRTQIEARRLPVQIGKPASFELEWTQPFGSLREGETGHASARLRHAGGLAASIKEVAPTSGFRQSGLMPGQRLSRGTYIDFNVTYSPQMSAASEARQSGAIVVEFADHSSYRIPLDLDIRRRPHVTIEGGRRGDVPEGLWADIALNIWNDGVGTAIVTELTAVDAPGWITCDAIDRVSIPQGENHPIRVHVNAAALPMGAKEYSVQLRAVLEEGDPARFELKGRVQPLVPYKHFVAIDFGTTNSCVAYWSDDDGVKLVPFVNGDDQIVHLVPSVAYFDETRQEWVAGFDALDAAERDARPELLVRSVKRLLNRGLGDTGTAEVDLGGRRESPGTVAAAIFRYLKRHTEQHLRKSIKHVMITVPANFSDTGLQAILGAAREAGLAPFQTENLDVWREYRLDEPTGAAIDALSERKDTKAEQLVVIFDFGGGTLDVSLLSVTLTSEVRRIRVLAHKGANWLGGDDFTRALVQLAAERFEQTTGKALRYDVATLERGTEWEHLDTTEVREAYVNDRLLWAAAEKAKIDLSTKTEVNLDVTLSVKRKPVPFLITITRAEFEARVERLVHKAIAIIDRAIKAAPRERGIQAASIDEVIATGSASLVPIVRATLADRFPRKILQPHAGFQEKECVARGACLYGVDNFEMAMDIDRPPLQCVGIHKFINCSYGYHSVANNAMVGELRFTPVIEEGTPVHDGKDTSAVTIKPDRKSRVTPFGTAELTFYQHTGDPADVAIRGNPDIVAIDTIHIEGVRVPDKRRPPVIDVYMWIAGDGMLDAEAAVDGHEGRFKLAHRHRI